MAVLFDKPVEKQIACLHKSHTEEDYVPRKIHEAYWKKNYDAENTIKQNYIGSEYKMLCDETQNTES